MLPPFHIRPATNDDTAGVVRVIRAVYDEYNFTWEEDGYHADLYDLEAHFPDSTFWVAEDDSEILGTAGLYEFPTIAGEMGTLTSDELPRIAGTDCGLARLYVHPDARRMGVGSALLRHTIDGAQSRNRALMEIWSDKRFVDAHRLYERMGAQVIGDRILNDPDESPEFGLILDLKN